MIQPRATLHAGVTPEHFAPREEGILEKDSVVTRPDCLAPVLKLLEDVLANGNEINGRDDRVWYQVRGGFVSHGKEADG
jgi:hypothetical protein